MRNLLYQPFIHSFIYLPICIEHLLCPECYIKTWNTKSKELQYLTSRNSFLRQVYIYLSSMKCRKCFDKVTYKILLISRKTCLYFCIWSRVGTLRKACKDWIEVHCLDQSGSKNWFCYPVILGHETHCPCKNKNSSYRSIHNPTNIVVGGYHYFNSK